MNLVRTISDYAVLATVRRRRGQALEDALREAEAALSAARARVAQAEAELGARLATLADYTARLRARTAPGAGVRPDDLRAARGHCDRLRALGDEAQAAVASARQGVEQAQAGCTLARRRIAQNDDRIRSLEQQRGNLVARRAREREEREDDERADVSAGRVPAVLQGQAT